MFMIMKMFLDDLLKSEFFVEKLEWQEARRDTLWLDQKTPRWWESSSTTRIKLETLESSMDANILPMASIQLVKLQQKPVDSHPTLRSSLERF